MVRKWCYKWGQHFHKTEVMLHSKNGKDNIIVVKESGTTLKQVDTRKLLGVVIDKNLTFKDQIEYATSKAESALNSISPIIKLRNDQNLEARGAPIKRELRVICIVG